MIWKNSRNPLIGILTFHWADDYGAMLQAYALKYYLKKVSKAKVEIIPYASVKLVGRYWLCPVTGSERNRKIRYFFMTNRFRRNLAFLHSFLKRRKSMREFRNKYLVRRLPVRRADKLSAKKYDCIFVGSDQVWNPEITIGLDAAYIGNIKDKENCKLVAYGASFGNENLPEKYRDKFTESVHRNYSSISLREKSAVPFVKSFFPGKVTDVLDPTLLLGKGEWKKIGKAPEERGYILFVYTENNKQMVQYLHACSAKLKKKVIQLTMPSSGQKAEWIELEIEGGPAEYIGFFQNADYVVTNSFHGMAFSILMEKQFLVFSHSDKNARIENVMEKLNLKSRMVDYGRMPAEELLLEKIDWVHVKELLEKEQEHSAEFIRNELL